MAIEDKPPEQTNLVDLAIRIGLLVGLAYWSWIIVRPLLALIVWSVVVAVALYPFFNRLANMLGGRRRLAAAFITIVCLLVTIGPVTWLGLGLVDGVQALSYRIDSGELTIPAPNPSIKGWPLIGQQVYDFWEEASTNLKVAFASAAPQLKTIGSSLLGVAKTASGGVLTFIISVIIAGFLLPAGPSLVGGARAFSQRIVRTKGDEFIEIAGATIHNVSRGVIGISILQAVLAGIGLVAAQVPAASFIAFTVLILGIIQVGPTIVLIPVIIWSWFALEPSTALIFTAYMVPVGLIDNVLRPIVMGRGLTTPMPVIFTGLIGGVLAHGFIGVFVGPIVLAVAWSLLVAWIADNQTSSQSRLSDQEVPGTSVGLLSESTSDSLLVDPK